MRCSNNPDTLSNTLQIRGVGAESGDHSEVLHLKAFYTMQRNAVVKERLVSRCLDGLLICFDS
jgi:hypothetical protein